MDECEARFLSKVNDSSQLHCTLSSLWSFSPFPKIAEEEKASLNAISDDDEHSAAGNKQQRRRQSVTATAGMFRSVTSSDKLDYYNLFFLISIAANVECLGSVRKSGFLSVKKWLIRKKTSLELARKRGWKG